MAGIMGHHYLCVNLAPSIETERGGPGFVSLPWKLVRRPLRYGIREWSFSSSVVENVIWVDNARVKSLEETRNG